MEKVKKAWLQISKRQFELLQMEKGKRVSNYSLWTLILVNKMKCNRENVLHLQVMDKFCKSCYDIKLSLNCYEPNLNYVTHQLEFRKMILNWVWVEYLD